MCGIEPNEAGFESVRIEPHLGILEWVEGSMPHQMGMISVKFQKTKSGAIKGEVQLPAGLTGIFVHQGKTMQLTEGLNKVGF